MKVNKLSSDELKELLHLCDNVKYAETDHRKFLDEKAPGLTYYKKYTRGGMKATMLSINNNKELLQFITKITKLPKEDLVSIHFTEYVVGSETLDHRDSNSSNTFLFLLNSAKKGGNLRIEGELIDFNEEGNWILYNGGSMLHGVTKVEEGYRRVLAVWYGTVPKKTLL